ncbi:hypothetical protein ACP70R_008443 [Stipagrostis hirtigluma subsp. patula]
MDPSVCSLHPGVAVTGFCPACLRDRLVGLHPPSSADLRRCKSFSYARSAAAASQSRLEEPHRRSCDLFRQDQHVAVSVPEEAPRMEEQEPSASRKSLGGLLGKKLQQWRRKNKPKKEPMPMPPEPEVPARHRQHSFRDTGRRSCDVDPRASWDGRSSVLARVPLTMLSVEEDAPVPRSDGQIPVEEDDDYYHHHDHEAAPGGSVQTRDYYLDSSSSSRRRRSLDHRSTTSGRNSFSDASELPRMNANAIAAEVYHAQTQSVLVHRQYCRDQLGPNVLRDDYFSGSFGSAFRDHSKHGVPPANKSKSWIKNIFGLKNKKSSRKSEADHHHGAFSAAATGGGGGYAWPELRARGYNGQMLRCNSSLSARSSFSGGAAMIGGSARRSISGVEAMHDVNGHGLGRTKRRDEVMLERNLSTRSSYSRELDQHQNGVHQYQQLSRMMNQNGAVSGNGRRRSSNKPSSLPRRSTLGVYSTDQIQRQ